MRSLAKQELYVEEVIVALLSRKPLYEATVSEEGSDQIIHEIGPGGVQRIIRVSRSPLSPPQLPRIENITSKVPSLKAVSLFPTSHKAEAGIPVSIPQPPALAVQSAAEARLRDEFQRMITMPRLSYRVRTYDVDKLPHLQLPISPFYVRARVEPLRADLFVRLIIADRICAPTLKILTPLFPREGGIRVEMLATPGPDVGKLRGATAFDMIFKDHGLRRLVGSIHRCPSEPVIVVAKKGCPLHLLSIICRELYREICGDYPEAVDLIGAEPDEAHRRLEWLEYRGGLERKIIVLDDLLLKDDKQKIMTLEIKRRLREAYSRGLGFIIISADDVGSVVSKVRNVAGPYMPKIVALEACNVDHIAIALKALGLLKEMPHEDEMILLPDHIASKADRDYSDFLDSILNDRYALKISRDIAEESGDHLALKALAAKQLIEMGVNPKSNCKLGEQIIADLCLEDGSIAVEVETLFKSGPVPVLKIADKVRKYKELKDRRPKIWVILRNWSAAIHLGDLYYVEKMLEKETGLEIKFFIPDIATYALKPLDSVVNELKALFTA